ncbi:protein DETOXIFICATION 21-like isoform X2 [Rhododendron vialii]|uniref:protein DETOXIFICATION 21-like isoform X2 n=1 Tax=Rhododendron vialii TaxID=182163 RepID=UPI00265F8701|nr:protein DETOXIFICATION 21-like isoform X2 [Rhododendron vialii]
MDPDIHENLLTNGKGQKGVPSEEKLKDRLWSETKKMWVVAGPAIFTRCSTFGITVISQAFIGHIGATELAGYALDSTVFLRFVNGIVLGMASGLETLCGQAYGANQYHMLGVYLQRSWMVLFTCTIFLVPLFCLTTPILKALGQDEAIAEEAGVIALWFIPVVFSFIPSLTCQMFLQTQSKNMIISYLAFCSLSLHIFLSWLLTVRYKFGIPGAMISTILAYWLPNMGQLSFVMCGGCRDTWKGFSFLAFKDLWPIIKLSLSSGAMLCLELWYNTVLILLTGNMENAEVEINALSICLNINGWEMMLAFGFLAAASEVAAAVAELSPLLACSILLNSVQPVLSGVAVGAGWQSIVAYVNITCYYLVGIPVGVVLGYVFHMQVKGVWIGMLFGTFVQTIVLIVITCKTDWDNQVSIARKRVNRWFVEAEEPSANQQGV